MFKHEVEFFSIIISILCYVHYYFYTGKKISEVIIFFAGAIFLGTLCEAVAILLTQSYYYPGFRWYVGPVPVFIAIGWGSTFYITYQIANTLTRRLREKKVFLLVYAIVCGLLGLFMDLNFDPVSVSLNWWEWKNGSPYYGIPIVNFIGWFFFCAGFGFVYKLIETSKWNTPKKTILFYLLLVPVFLVTSLITMPFL